VVAVVAQPFHRALVPDDHRAAAAPRALVHALELAGRERVVLDRDGEPPVGRIHGRALGDGPGPQHAALFEPQVEVQRRRVVLLDDEAWRGQASAPV
jgi:hypothetical protein